MQCVLGIRIKAPPRVTLKADYESITHCTSNSKLQERMESLKELLTPKSFNKFSYVGIIFWILFGVTLFGIFADTENSESRFDFSCEVKSSKDLIEGRCFEQYEELYNKLGIPVYGFVIANFSVIAIVSVIYSQSVKSKVNELDAEHSQDQQEIRRGRKPRGLFIAYVSQLVLRISFGILFIVLQTQVLYGNNFPSNFKCELMPTAGNNSVTPSTNITPVTQVFQCHNQRASKKTFWINAVSVVNGIFVFLVFIEIVCILSRARKSVGRRFMEDKQFFTDHLMPSARDNTRESTQHSEPTSHEISQLSPQEPVELPEQNQGEQIQEPLPQDSIEQEPHQVQSEMHCQQPPLQDFIKTIKESVKKGTEQLIDLKQPYKRPNPGEGSAKDLNINEIYTNLKIQEGRAKIYNFPTDRREQLQIYPQPNPNKSEFNRPEDIIDAEHKNILVVGRPGIGKTLFCTKLLRDWASDKVFSNEQNLEPDYDIAFLLKFRRLSKLTTHINLRELLCDYSEYPTYVNDEVWEYILKNPNKLLLMFDGTDEFPRHSEIAQDYSACTNTAEGRMPVLALYQKIADGKLLSGATVITTTRPTAVSSLTHLKFDRVVEILGFTSQQVKDYVEKFTKEDQDADRVKETIWQHISGNLNLFSLSYIPVNCFIICSCLFYVLRNCDPPRLPTKLTEIYSIAIKIFFSRHSSEKYRSFITNCDQFVFKNFRALPSQIQDVFKRLGKIAFKGIEESRIIFGSREVEGLEDCGLLHRLPDRAGPLTAPPEEQFCFIHLTVQEFMAAKHLTDTLDDKELKTFVSDNISYGKWAVVTQFIAGLLQEREVPLTHIFTDLLPAKTEEKNEREVTGIWDKTSEDSEPRTLTCWPAKEDKDLALNLCKCLNETNVNNSVIEEKLSEINFNAVNFSLCSLAPVDCSALVHVFQNTKGISCMNLRDNNIGPLGCEEIAKLANNDKLTCSLNLAENGITDKGVNHLSEALKQSKLETLILAVNLITDKGVNHLSEALKQSKLKTLNLRNNQITEKGVEHLSEALKESKLKTLNLACNQITDKGVEHLSEALKQSKLETLILIRNQITDKGVEHLSEALKQSKLETLDLARNQITDKGVNHLSEALKQSKLETLNLAYNRITDKGVEHLSEALKQSKLETLNLAYNRITDKGVEHLSEALKQSKLETLNLAYNRITDKGVEHLSEALKQSKLETLNLAGNQITDKGVKHLSEALKQSKLETLDLRNNQITDKGVEHLSEALKQSKLETLDLAFNQITDKGVEHLSEALKQSKLETLNLAINRITDKGVEHLSEALKESKLETLNLAYNQITDKGVEHLSEALKQSKLETLDLRKNQITDKGVEHLSEALKQSKLETLYLTGNQITDKGKEFLDKARTPKTTIIYEY